MTAAQDGLRLARAREQRRQHSLLRALNGGGRAALSGWTHLPSLARHTLDRGLATYVANAAALAERSLAARFPTVQALMGGESFAQLARHLWRAEPAEHGDLAQWGHGLPAFIAASTQLASEPYLADVARLDAACADAAVAADVELRLDTLAALATQPADTLHPRLAAGATLLSSAHPVVDIWDAHHPSDATPLAGDRFAAVRAAMARAAAYGNVPDAPFQTALVWRAGWRLRVRKVDGPQRRFIAALLRGDNLAGALDQAGAAFDFEAWLLDALRGELLCGLEIAP